MGLMRLTPERVGGMLKSGMITICVVGLGRIGLPTAAVFAKAGARVLGTDIKPEVVASVNEGACRFTDEPGLPEIVAEVVRSKKLEAYLDAGRAVSQADVTIISVPTPVDEGKTPDYTAVKAASHTVGKTLQDGSIVVVESTVGPGTVENLIRPILESESGLKAGVDFGLASCPERSDPGNVVSNMFSVPRVIGAINGQCLGVTAALYEAALGVDAVKVSSPRTANAVKLTENLFRDVNIALANEFSLLYESLGIDTFEVINACASKYNFMPHYPGAGVGGPCLPSNSYYLISEGVKAGNIPYLIRMAREINDRMPEHVVELVSEALNDVAKTVRGSRIAVLGVTYKPNIKDVQLSPIGKVCSKLASMGGQVAIYDPFYEDEMVFGIRAEGSLEDAVRGADCVVIGTAHSAFRRLDLASISALVGERAALVDGRGVVDPAAVAKAGLAYRGVGRPVSKEPSFVAGRTATH